MNKRVFYLDFIRALAAFMIIVFHFNVSVGSHGVYNNSSTLPIIFYEYKNGNLGQIGVSLFFIISGGGLMLSCEKEFEVLQYIRKRILAIFPMFYTAYFIVLCYYFFRYLSLNPFGVLRDKWTFVLTVIGMDGYLSSVISNYYLIGEWFLGCIILFYFLFPLLRYLLLKTGPWISMGCVLAVYLLTVYIYPFREYNIEYFVFARIVEFFLGMLSVKYFQKIKGWQFGIALIVIAIWLVFFVPIAQIHKTVLMGIFMYIVLAYIGQNIGIKYQKSFMIISKYSYPVFLLHHVIIEQICARFENTHLALGDTYFLLMICIIAIAGFTVLFSKFFKEFKNILNNVCLLKGH